MLKRELKTNLGCYIEIVASIQYVVHKLSILREDKCIYGGPVVVEVSPSMHGPCMHAVKLSTVRHVR